MSFAYHLPFHGIEEESDALMSVSEHEAPIIAKLEARPRHCLVLHRERRERTLSKCSHELV